MEEKKKEQSFWTTLPGILTGCAAMITAIGGCVVIILSNPGLFFPATPTPILTPIPPTEQVTLVPSTNTPVIQIMPTTPAPFDTPTVTQVPPTLPPTPTSTPTIFVVFAKERWQPTGVQVRNGNIIQITYITGLWSVRTVYTPTHPKGLLPADDQVDDPECIFQMLRSDVGDNALIAKIGENGEPFNPFQNTRTGEGMLYLRLNDCDKYLDDNYGSVTIQIQLIR